MSVTRLDLGVNITCGIPEAMAIRFPFFYWLQTACFHEHLIWSSPQTDFHFIFNFTAGVLTLNFTVDVFNDGHWATPQTETISIAKKLMFGRLIVGDWYWQAVLWSTQPPENDLKAQITSQNVEHDNKKCKRPKINILKWVFVPSQKMVFWFFFFLCMDSSIARKEMVWEQLPSCHVNHVPRGSELLGKTVMTRCGSNSACNQIDWWQVFILLKYHMNSPWLAIYVMEK
jgi:hypothetical protein